MEPSTTASAANLDATARDIIDRLALEPHPEGGWFRETFLDHASDGTRRSTAIYFLLTRGERSHWHRVLHAAEVWHRYAGDPIRLRLSPDGISSEEHLLGADLVAGQRPQVVVPIGWWQSAETLGEWTLAGCTVAPGFDFDHFELAPPAWGPGA